MFCLRRNFYVVCLRKVYERFLDVIMNFLIFVCFVIDVFVMFDLFGDDGRFIGDVGVVVVFEEFFEELFVKVDVVVKFRFVSFIFV